MLVSSQDIVRFKDINKTVIYESLIRFIKAARESYLSEAIEQGEVLLASPLASGIT